jgi:FPC/CPF motif-containing protein YcgG
LVFNDHFQFEKLRAEHRFERMRDTIRERDSKLHGSTNPMVSDYGAHSEASQYSGRNVPSDWKCPIRFDKEPP